jgi:hypothetical protein
MESKTPSSKLIAFFLICMLTACPAIGVGGDLRYFEFAMRGFHPGENFIAATSVGDIIVKLENQLALPESDRYLHINGMIDSGSGGYNFTWSWHFTKESWDIVHMSVEVCDGSASFVEANLAYWLDTLGYFCPWNSYVLREIPGFICGDADGSGGVDMLDILCIIAYLYKDGPVPSPIESADTNGDDSVDMLDILYLVAYLYKGGPEPVCTRSD